MAIILTNTATAVSDGTKPLLISIQGEANETTKYLYYGFGAVAPTDFHVYNSISNQPLLIGTDFGITWLKTDAPDIHVNISIGL